MHSFKPVGSNLRPLGKKMRTDVNRTDRDVSSDLARVKALLNELAVDMASMGRPELDISKGIDFYETVEEFKRDIIVSAMELCAGHKSKVARLLHVKPSTLHYVMKRLGI